MMNTNKRTDNRSKGYSNGPTNGHANRGKTKPMNHTVNFMEGVYGNSRFSYGVTCLIGCTVVVEVKNGSRYEGVFLTFSPKMEIVLQMAHRVEGKQEGPCNKDQLIDAIIFKPQDVVSITATNVDLDYATRDSFTDSAISKFNGEVRTKKLERWDGDGGPNPSIDLSLGGGENGWEVEDMFKTNAEKYDVKSSYDANLSAYTTKLEIDDSAEGRAKAARAARLASEIEGTDSHWHCMELENADEGEIISAVVKEPVPSYTDRYVPPHLRKQYAIQQGAQSHEISFSKAMTVNGTDREGSTSAPPQQSISSSPASSENCEGIDEKNDQNKDKKILDPSNTIPQQQTPHTQESNISASATIDIVSQNNTDEPEEMKVSPVTAAQHKPLHRSKSEYTQSDDHMDSVSTSKCRPNKTEHKKSGRDDLKAEINELRDFSDNFNIKLDSEETRETKRQRTSSQTSEAALAPTTAPEPRNTPQKADSATGMVVPVEDPKDNKKSCLNPNALEFTLNPNAREFKPAVAPKAESQHVSTSPRPQPQSPVIQPAIAMHHQQIYAPAAYMNMTTAPLATPILPAEPQLMPKRAVVSVVRADPTAQALAATGTPLQAQPAGGIPGAPQYTLQPIVFGPGQTMPQTFGHAQGPVYNQQLVQMTNNGPRILNAQMGAQMAQFQYAHPHHQQMSHMANVNVHQPQQQVYITGPGISQTQPATQMIQPNQHQHYGTTHHGSRSTPPQQTSHPIQGPPQQTAGQGQPQHHGQQPIYHHNGQLPPGGQPPLQPSPHTPASPQAQQPPGIPISYSFSQPPIPTQTHNPAMHQIATNYMQMTPQVSYTAHHAHGPPPQNQVMMVHQTSQHHLQGQAHHMSAHGPPQMQAPVHMSQSGHPMSGPQPGMTPVNMGTGQLHYTHQPSPR